MPDTEPPLPEDTLEPRDQILLSVLNLFIPICKPKNFDVTRGEHSIAFHGHLLTEKELDESNDDPLPVSVWSIGWLASPRAGAAWDLTVLYLTAEGVDDLVRVVWWRPLRRKAAGDNRRFEKSITGHYVNDAGLYEWMEGALMPPPAPKRRKK